MQVKECRFDSANNTYYLNVMDEGRMNQLLRLAGRR